MTEEIKALAGKSDDLLANLTWRDMLSFVETFGVGMDEISSLDPATQIKATAWLVWRAHCRKTGEQIDFETFLDTPIPREFFSQ